MPSTIRIRRCGLAILGFVCRILIVFLLELVGLTRRQLKLVDHIDRAGAQLNRFVKQIERTLQGGILGANGSDDLIQTVRNLIKVTDRTSGMATPRRSRCQPRRRPHPRPARQPQPEQPQPWRQLGSLRSSRARSSASSSWYRPSPGSSSLRAILPSTPLTNDADWSVP